MKIKRLPYILAIVFPLAFLGGFYVTAQIANPYAARVTVSLPQNVTHTLCVGNYQDREGQTRGCGTVPSCENITALSSTIFIPNKTTKEWARFIAWAGTHTNKVTLANCALSCNNNAICEVNEAPTNCPSDCTCSVALPTGTCAPGNTCCSYGSCASVCLTNAPPVFQPIQTSQTVATGSVININLAATDPDGDTLTYSVDTSTIPGGASYSVGPTGSFSWTAMAINTPPAGVFTLRFYVSDGHNVATPITFTITVTPVINGAPVWSNLTNRTVSVGNNLTFQVQATDPENDPLFYSPVTLTVPACGYTFNGVQTALYNGGTSCSGGWSSTPTTGPVFFTWTPTAANVGVHSFQFATVDRYHNWIYSNTFTITVNP
jgi:hypothetical protein